MKKDINKAVLVIVLSLTISLINYFVYPIINQSLNPVIKIPISNKTMKRGDIISQQDIAYIEVNDEIENDILTDIEQIVGQQVKNEIPAKCLFTSELLGKIDISNNKYIINLETDNDVTSGYTDIFYIGSDYRQNNKKIIGLLASNVEIISYQADKKQISLLVDEKQLDYCLKAKQLGDICLIQNQQYSLMTEYYSIDMLYSYLDEYAISFRMVNYE